MGSMKICVFFFIVISSTFCLMCTSKDKLAGTCKNLPYTQVVKNPPTNIGVLTQNIQNDLIWSSFGITQQNEILCVAAHPPCKNNRTFPICLQSCVKYFDNLFTFENSVKIFCKTHLETTAEDNCHNLGKSNASFVMPTLGFFIIAISLLI